MGDAIAHIGDDSFKKEVLDSATPVLVDFWATWCGPCRAIAPALEDFANRYKGKVKIVKLNIDDHQAVPQQFGIRSIPTLLLFKGGQVVDQVVGADKSRIEQMIQKAAS